MSFMASGIYSALQDVVVQKLRLQGERGRTGGHGAAHQMNVTQATKAKSLVFGFFIDK